MKIVDTAGIRQTGDIVEKLVLKIKKLCRKSRFDIAFC